jgi:hypothetical protein
MSVLLGVDQARELDGGAKRPTMVAWDDAHDNDNAHLGGAKRHLFTKATKRPVVDGDLQDVEVPAWTRELHILELERPWTRRKEGPTGLLSDVDLLLVEQDDLLGALVPRFPRL